MILWIVLFLLIIAVSIILAFRSMEDYQELPHQSGIEHGLYLIRNTAGFDTSILNSIGETMICSDSPVVSIERLFKGSETALTIFGPKTILSQFTDKLDLLELEDYSSEFSKCRAEVWEVGIKKGKKFDVSNVVNLFGSLSKLAAKEQFFWQIVLGVKKSRNGIFFQAQIRAVYLTPELVRERDFVPELHNLGSDQLAKVPSPYSEEQLLNFFNQRVLDRGAKGLLITSSEVLQLLKITKEKEV